MQLAVGAISPPASAVLRVRTRGQAGVVQCPLSSARSDASSAQSRHGTAPRSRATAAARVVAAASTVAEGSNGATATSTLAAPKPAVQIDNQTDPFSTIVSIQYGDRLGELLDTVAALRNLNLNIRRAKLKRDNEKGVIKHKFFITDRYTADKITKSARLEEIRLTILNNLMLYHPESTGELAWGPPASSSRDYESDSEGSGRPALGVRSRRAINTLITVVPADGEVPFSKLQIRTKDRPGLLVEIVKVLKDINVNVISAEIDTEGKEAIDTFLVSYHGEPLDNNMSLLVTNALHYYLSLTELEKEESY